MSTGTIEKWFPSGYRFIKVDGATGWNGLFFHAKNFPKDVEPAVGMALEFDIAQGNRGDFANNIRVKPPAPVQFGDGMEAA